MRTFTYASKRKTENKDAVDTQSVWYDTTFNSLQLLYTLASVFSRFDDTRMYVRFLYYVRDRKIGNCGT